MFGFLCKVLGHNFRYIRRYYRCIRCGVRRCDLTKGVKVNASNN